MSFNFHASIRLSLAITAIITAQAALADSNDGWDCRVNTEGEWDCSFSQQSGNLTTGSAARAVTQAQAQAQSDDIRLRLSSPFAHLDYYPYPQGQAPGLCHGGYIEPDVEFMDDDAPFSEQPIFADAIESSADLNTRLTRLVGGINLRQGSRMISSEYGEIDQDNMTAFLEGQIRYREKGLLLIGDRADANFETGDTHFINAQYVMHEEHMRGSAKRISRYGDNRVVMEKGALTFCEPGNDAWQIKASSVELDLEEGFGTARHAVFAVANVPVFYIPYFKFPIDDRRVSGFLYPSGSFSRNSGLQLNIPYYFNLAPNYDDTLVTRVIEKRGLLLENEFRYMNEWSISSLSTSYLHDDNIYGKNRWLTEVEHEGAPFKNWFSRIHYTRVSDDDYFNDLGTKLDVEEKDHLDQLVEMRYTGNGWNFTGRVHGYQTIIDGKSPYERKPQLLFTGREALPADAQFTYIAEYVNFQRDLAGLTGNDRIVGDRLHLRPSVSYLFERPWGYAKPKVSLWHSQYQLDNTSMTQDSRPSVTTPVTSLDTGLYFDREYSRFSQSLEPRLMLLDVPGVEQPSYFNFDSARMGFSYYNLFNEYGWSGNDTVADTRQATLGLSSGFYTASGSEKARLGVAQAHYFRDRDILRPGDRTGNENSSNYALLASWNISDALRFTHDSEIDRNSLSTREQNYKLTFTPDDLRLLYISYRDKKGTNNTNDSTIRQSDIGFRYPINPKWNVIGRWQYDHKEGENLDTLFGVEYGTCCWKMRVTARRWLSGNPSADFEQDTGLFVQFVLRGLGTIGPEGGRGFIEEITGIKEDDHDKF
ncbi:LPS-assembly protein LptD [Nitrincola alkalilacustris]|uniref:LPS-assembly protein LptD n=1 Tax=Nitrincola alkalilacustris TaxID=1571224 RepID=UPI00124E3C80|nr:LPS-assembly protein LptD [Nitrincola alkalilacustris]